MCKEENISSKFEFFKKVKNICLNSKYKSKFSYELNMGFNPVKELNVIYSEENSRLNFV